ncbi:pyruvate kinase [Magnetospira sp. QH-2]|uniref:pyruvate kinase n=1 Tax=Magnetospira sp. (strain QH-2) TaxID=1288970 RepID=UPI0003E81B2E|nr:pyruvate kinase [Magnetospira sp. QH-2]CCQ74096.1 Pyruvate kinase [Magnetospira sp. QH-2]
MRRKRQAKILATLGPTTSTRPRLQELIDAGADVFRLNFSHGSYEDHQRRYDLLRQAEQENNRPISILMDLQGPKLRVGKFGHGAVRLQTGSPFRLDLLPEPGNQRRVMLPHPEIFEVLKEGHDLLLDDGKVRLRVMHRGDDFVDTQVITPGELSDNKGVNVPDAMLNLSALTDKDRKDLDYGLKMGVDWVALSFVQKPEDIAEVRKIVAGRAAVMAKLEKPTAIEYLDEIIDLSDGLMIARGDLGVEFPPEEVPALQKQIIRACRKAGKPVVVATQMLDSMVRAPAPTRAEASDVATAVYDGADAMMLSAETAVGDYPVESVSMMDRIIQRVERDHYKPGHVHRDHSAPEATAADAISAAAAQVARTITASAIVSFTFSGSTALRAARERPEAPILGLTPNVTVARRLALVWGIHPVLTADILNLKEMIQKSVSIAKDEGFAEAGERLVVMAGIPFGTPGATNTLHIPWVE